MGAKIFVPSALMASPDISNETGFQVETLAVRSEFVQTLMPRTAFPCASW